MTQTCFNTAEIPRPRQSEQAHGRVFLARVPPKRDNHLASEEKFGIFEIGFEEIKGNCQESVKIYRKTQASNL